MRDDKVEKLKDPMLYDSEDSKIMEFIISEGEQLCVIDHSNHSNLYKFTLRFVYNLYSISMNSATVTKSQFVNHKYKCA